MPPCRTLAAAVVPPRDATVVPDPHITRGGCVIDTVHGQIDARIEPQIDRIVEELTQE